jgi:hypothetical protein
MNPRGTLLSWYPLITPIMRLPALDPSTLNAARKVASTALKAYVCELEQKALDAARCRDYQSAKLNSDWAFAADLCVLKVSAALSELIVQALNAPPLKSQESVQLPSLERPAVEQRVELATVRLLRPEKPDPEPPSA